MCPSQGTRVARLVTEFTSRKLLGKKSKYRQERPQIRPQSVGAFVLLRGKLPPLDGDYI